MNTISIWTHVVCFVSMVCGFSCLMSAMPRHQKVMFKRSLSVQASRWGKILGWGLIGLGVTWTAHLESWPFSWVALMGHATAAALLVVLGVWFWDTKKVSSRSVGGNVANKSASSTA